MSAAKTPPALITRLMLITPELDDIAAFEPMLEAAVNAGDVAAVVIRLAMTDERTRIDRAKTLIGIVQSEGAAALLCGEGVADILGKSGADGLHASPDDPDFADTVARFHPDRIVGAAAARTRDAAMEAGEAGADYVTFGDDVGGRPFSETIERVSWWTPIFETPCIGVAQTIEDVAALAAAHAEFAALGEAVWRHANGPASATAAAQAMLSLAQAPKP